MKTSKFILHFALLTLLLASTATAQSLENTMVTIRLKKASLKDVIIEIEKQTPFRFAFVENEIGNKNNVNFNFIKSSLTQLLAKIFDSTDIAYKLVDKNMIVLKRKPSTANNQVITEKKTLLPIELVVSGTVKDPFDNPIFGTTVKIKGTNISTLTDKEGQFSIKLNKPTTILVISHIGYLPVEESVSSSTEGLFIKLFETSSKLDEVIVVGYGSVKKRDLTGSVGKVNMEDFHKAPVSSFDQALQGRVAGVVVSSNDGQPGAGSQISIRGTSFTQDASPLYVVDGFPMENMNINSINPADIESLEILKDASSIAIYGSRAANGVIMITTRKGKVSSPTVSYNFSSGFQIVTKTIEMMNPYEFVKLQLELDSIASTPTSPITRNRQIYLNPALGFNLDYYKNVEGINWQKQLIRDGSIQTHDLSITGGSADTKYAFSGSAFNQKGIIVNTGLKRYSGRFSIDMKLSKSLNWGLQSSFTNSLSSGTVPTSGNGGGVVQSMWQFRPVSGFKNSQDLINNLIDSTALLEFLNGTSSSLGDNQINPFMQAQNELRKSRKNDATINTFLNYTFLKNFKLRVAGGYSAVDLKYATFYNANTQQGNLFVNSAGGVSNANGINGGISNVLTQNILNENTLTYNGRIDQNNIINLLAGFTYQYGQSENYGLQAINIQPSQQFLGINSLSAGTPSSVGSGRQHHQLYSFLARGNYSLYQKYLFTATIRSDGSSKFAPGHQWGYFPSAAFAWRFTDEKWIKGILKSIITNGKFRMSYGSVGNNRVPDVNYAWQGSLSPSNGYAVSNGQFLPGYVPVFLANPNLTWETTKEFDFGVNFTLFNDRVTIEADYYDKRTSNFLMNINQSAISGYNNVQQYQNTGVVRNRGIEFSFTSENVIKKYFSWQTNFNISFNQNKILSFYNNINTIGSNWGLGASQAWIAKVGGPVTQFFGYKTAGLYQYEDFIKLANGNYVLKSGQPTYSPNVQPGDQKYVDLNQDGIINANDQTTLGSFLPIHTGGITNNFKYKNFSLNIFIFWSYGGKVLNANRVAFETTGNYFAFGNQFAAYADRWQPNNTNTDIPKARVVNPKGDASDNIQNPSSRFIEDGSYARLKTVQLNYDLPASVIRRLTIKRAAVFIAAQNLLTLTRYSGLDPEVSTNRVFNSARTPIANTGNVESGLGYTYIQPSSGSAVLSAGYDFTPYPRALTVTAGVKVVF